MGLIAAVGEDIQLMVGTPVALLAFGSYAEFTEVINLGFSFQPFFSDSP